MKTLLSSIKTALLFVMLTILTQVGGLVYLLYQPISYRIKKRVASRWKQFSFRVLTFSLMMLFASLVLVPPIAKQFGRVPLPLFAVKDRPVKPASILLCFANRHYVRPQLKTATFEIAEALKAYDSEAQLIYLDANFPFWNDFPLLPHLSHDDGGKLDLTFLYKHAKTGKRLRRAPTFFGYGHCEIPAKGELNQPKICADKGHWQYNLIEKITPPHPKFKFDEKGNQQLLQIITRHKKIGKIFLEPHLETRLGLGKYKKVRYHGCRAVRHDDHIHIQL